MTEEFGDSRPRRRLFGRRRPDEEVAERPAPVNADDDQIPPAPPSPAPILTSDDASESWPESEADRPAVTTEPEERPMDSSTGSTGQEPPARPSAPPSEAPAAVSAIPPRPVPAAAAPVSPAPMTREPAPPAPRPQATPVATEPPASPTPTPTPTPTPPAAATVTREPDAPTSGHPERAAAPAPVS